MEGRCAGCGDAINGAVFLRIRDTCDLLEMNAERQGDTQNIRAEQVYRIWIAFVARIQACKDALLHTQETPSST